MRGILTSFDLFGDRLKIANTGRNGPFLRAANTLGSIDANLYVLFELFCLLRIADSSFDLPIRPATASSNVGFNALILDCLKATLATGREQRNLIDR